MQARAWLCLPTLLLVGACHHPSVDRDPGPPPPPAKDPPNDEALAPTRTEEHQVVFADRITHAYLLLIDRPNVDAPSRDQLQQLIEQQSPASERGPEFDAFLQMIATPTDQQSPERPNPNAMSLHLEALVLNADLVHPAVLQDPLLTRTLSVEQRAGLPSRSRALLLRADYRNHRAILGLRLLQRLATAVAREYDALIYDPDTQETLSPAAFERQQLRSTLTNIAEQIVVVPFADDRHGRDLIRLSTRGMRRFGSVDLELEGLPRSAGTLQAGSDFLNGLAYKMVRLGEIDPRGFAVELDETVTLEHQDIIAAYGGSQERLSPCEGCRVDVHLVKRAPEPHDPAHHVVARVVAPPDQSEAATYDQPAWVLDAISAVLTPRS